MNRLMDANTDAEPEPSAATKSAGPRQTQFSRYAWFVLAYVVAVILFGAWVRITGSGAGCGQHWPTCHGEVIPRSPNTNTIIEYTHRVSSGLLGPMALLLCIGACRLPGRSWAVRIAALLTLLFILLEGLIGAGLVLGELVASDDSAARAIVIALHLGNTLLLTAVCALTAHWGAEPVRGRIQLLSPRMRPLLLAAVAVVLVSMSGAVTALGDTLFPVVTPDGAGVLSHLKNDLAPGAHFLLQLRVLHPVLAVVVGLALAWYCQRLSLLAGPERRLAAGCAALTWLQLALGAMNVAFRAPGPMQLLHLLVAQALWVSLVLLIARRAAWSPLDSPAAASTGLHARSVA